MSTRRDIERMLIAAVTSPTIVRIVKPTRTITRMTVGGIDVSPSGDLTVVAPPGAAEPVAVTIDVAPAPSDDSLPFVVEILTGSRTYREVVPATGRKQLLHFSLVYGEPAPDLIDCLRHGLVRPKNGVCPEAPPHT